MVILIGLVMPWADFCCCKEVCIDFIFHSEIVPITPLVVIPSLRLMLGTSTVLLCGIQSNTTEFTTQWRRPNGDTISATGATGGSSEDRFRVQNGPVSPFPHGTLLSVMNLIYTDAGDYTCSVTFTGGVNNGTTLSCWYDET